MSDQILLETLHEILRELTEKQEKNRNCVDKCRAVVSRLTEGLNRVKEQEACAIHEDEQIQEKQNILRAYLNNLSDKPPAMKEKLDSFQAAQFQVSRKRQGMSETVRGKEQELHDAKIRLTVKEKERDALQSQWKDVSEHILRINEVP